MAVMFQCNPLATVTLEYLGLTKVCVLSLDGSNCAGTKTAVICTKI